MNNINQSIPQMIMLCGLPASGKSTFAQILQEMEYHVYSLDVIREELLKNADKQDQNVYVFEVLHKRIKKDLLNRISCVYDDANLSMKKRKSFLNELKNIPCIKKCILFATPIKVCKERNNNRHRKVPDEVFDKMIRSFWIPMKYEGWDEIEVHTIPNYIYDYPIRLTYNFDQKNSHHSMMLFDHMLQTAKYICKNSDEKFKNTERYRNLLWAAHNHDIGKVVTQTFINAKGEQTKEAHYYGHDNAGAYLYLLSELYSDSFNPIFLSNIFYRSALINWHMRPYISWNISQKSMNRDKKLIGEQMFDDIMTLHEADRAAH